MNGTDGGASLYISKVMQNKVTGLKQAEANTETSISLVQTAEAALADVAEILTSMKQLAVHAANEATNDPILLETDQMEIEELLNAIKQKTEMTTFAGKKLLNGSMGISGSVDGDHLRFVEAEIDTPGSPIEGFAIDITQPATRSVMVGSQPLTVEHVGEGIKIASDFRFHSLFGFAGGLNPQHLKLTSHLRNHGVFSYLLTKNKRK